MRAESWSGLITNASPFALPPGAAVEQTNLATHIPGQLTLRGGMRPVAFDFGEAEAPTAAPVSLATYSSGDQTVVLCLFSDGTMAALPSPDAGDSLAAPSGDELASASGVFATSYTQAFDSEPT